jgi:hypothetical protein
MRKGQVISTYPPRVRDEYLRAFAAAEEIPGIEVQRESCSFTPLYWTRNLPLTLGKEFSEAVAPINLSASDT